MADDETPTDLLARVFDRGDHYPKRTCLGCGGAGRDSTYEDYGGRYRATIHATGETVELTQPRLNKAIKLRRIGQMRLGL